MTADNFAWAVLGFLAGFFTLGLIVLRAALMAEDSEDSRYPGQPRVTPPLAPGSPPPPEPRP